MKRSLSYVKSCEEHGIAATTGKQKQPPWRAVFMLSAFQHFSISAFPLKTVRLHLGPGLPISWRAW
jgi:hypothetical protein